MEENQKSKHICDYGNLELVYEGVHLSVISGGFIKQPKADFEKYKIYKCPICAEHYVKVEKPIPFRMIKNG